MRALDLAAKRGRYLSPKPQPHNELPIGIARGRTGVETALGNRLTPFRRHSTFKVCIMSAAKIQIGQLWKQDGTGDIYLVTRIYSEALNTMVILRKSGSEKEAHTRVRVERTPKGQTIPGFSPAMDNEKY
jgi:hypothetical protein